MATVGASGTPHVVPVGWSLNADLDAIEIGGHDFAQTKKFRDVQSHGRAAVVIDDLASTDPWRPRGIEVRGRAEAVESPRQLIRIHPERIVSWGIDPRGRFSRAVDRRLQAPAGGKPMETAFAGLHASAPQALPFAPALDARAFLLQGEQGNLLVYSTTTVDVDASRIEDLGGVFRRYLNHWHEAGFGCDAIRKAFPAPLVCHERDRDSAAARCSIDETFAQRGRLDDDFEVIPTPGHTSGATAFLWDSGEHRFLFTGDTLYLDHGEWVAAVLDSSDRDAYIESLELIRTLDFDVLVPWIATGGQPFHAVTDETDAKARIDAILERLRRGETR